MSKVNRKRRWGLILAGGDGVRLRPLTRFISGDERPKQFCPLFGGVTLLEQARQRAARSIDSEQILFVLNRVHEEFYLPTLADCPSQRVVQPRNCGTASAILSGLLVIARKDPTAFAAVYPSDHYYSDENALAEAVDRGFELARRLPNRVVLLGAKPYGPEAEYGWIEPGAPMYGRRDAFEVRGFHEKPPTQTAKLLLAQNSLWNTFVMIGNTLAFLEMFCSAMPGLLTRFQRFPPLNGANGEIRIEDALYENMPGADFSKQVLSVETNRLIVQLLDGSAWSDLGDSERVTAALSQFGIEPEWATDWRATAAAPANAAAVVA